MHTKKLIINADDFGHTMGTSYGIIESHLRGVVKSTTAVAVSPWLMPSMAAAESLAPKLQVGIHLCLSLKGAKPVLPPSLVPSLVNEQGYFWGIKEVPQKACPNEVRMEYEAQMLRFLDSGRRPTHIDSHHFIHGATPEILQVTVDLARKYNLPLRRTLSRQPDFTAANLDIKTTCEIFVDFYDAGETMESLIKILDKIADSTKNVFELMCHPAYADFSQENQNGYGEGRVRELAILTSDEAKAAIAERNILLADFRCL